MDNEHSQINNLKIDFIGIGAQKCATTWIARCLKEHPEICFSDPKEINFFNKYYTFYQKDRGWNYLKGLSWYKKHFAHCTENKLKGEFSTAYLYDKDAPYLIKKTFPDVKVIVCLRNPIERTFSQYHHDLYKFPETKIKLGDFKTAIYKEPEFVQRGMYYKQLKRYFELFSKKNILILIYEDIEKNPLEFIQDIYKFLKINSNFTPPSLKQRLMTGRHYYFYPIHKPMKSGLNFLKKYPLLLNLIKKLRVYSFFKWIKKINRKSVKKYPEIPTLTKKDLQRIFKEDIKNLEKLINRNLSFWF